ncbi:MAG TPA: adenylyl-sulfate kinase [Acidimicrobiales bacterium]|nr:adenylyl-sulfate kinase [Acidimicrobiales bacterium]
MSLQQQGGLTAVVAGAITEGASEAPKPSRHVGGTVWFTGLSGAGKSTVAAALARALRPLGVPVFLLDGDDIRKGLSSDLGFSEDDRVENVRRVAEVARLFSLAGHLTLVSLISPFAIGRERARARHESSGVPFVEVYVATPADVCEQRDPKGLYARARRGEIPRFTGVSDPYEPPEAADVVLETVSNSPDESAADVLEALRNLGLI